MNRIGSLKKPSALYIVLGLGLVLALFGLTSYFTARDFRKSLAFDDRNEHFEGKGEIAVLKIEGVIMGSDEVIEKIDELDTDDSVKGVVIRINSPGGAVGPSQEIFQAVREMRSKKKVYCSLGDLAASGGYYIAAGCERIFANPGTLTGSIGVIMQFFNLKGLYDWAKVDPMVMKAGHFKDVGSEVRAMTDEERKLLQTLLNEVHDQFKRAIYEGRNSGLDTAAVTEEGKQAGVPPEENAATKTAEKSAEKSTDKPLEEVAKADAGPPPRKELSMETIEKYGDGRIFTGEQGQRLGFVDELGSLRDTTLALADDLGLPDDFDIRYEHEPGRGIQDFFEFSADPDSKARTSLLDRLIDRVLPSAQGSLKLQPGVPYYLPSTLFGGHG